VSWRDLLQVEGETVTAPWVGGSYLRTFDRQWRIDDCPREHGWWRFGVSGRVAVVVGPAEASPDALRGTVSGYLVADRLVGDHVVVSDPVALLSAFPRVHLVERGVGRFERVVVGRFCEDGPLVYVSPDMPLGAEMDVLQAFEDRVETVAHVPDVAPALDAAFRVETWRREEVERRRREERERREREELRRRVAERRGDAVGRRQLAAEDFGEAAQAALAVGDAVYLDHRPSGGSADEMVVTFRLGARRFQCTCHRTSLGIIDAGLCLEDHDTGVRGDSWLTLESLPSTIRQAEREGKLVVLRHVL